MSEYNSRVRAQKVSLKKLLSTTALTAASVAALFAPTKALADDPWSDFYDIETGSITITLGELMTLIEQHSDIFIASSGTLNIPEGYTVNLIQPDENSVFAARSANGVDPVQILGALNANGNVIIMDPNGVMFGNNSVVDVGGLIATSGTISTEQLQSNQFGQYTIDNIGSDPGAQVIMNGTINVRNAGLAAFVAPTVINNGVINATMGKVAMASGEQVVLDMYGDNLVEVTVPGQVAALLENTGEINAEGGTVVMSAAVAEGIVDNLINVSGIINVSSATMQGGKIVLSGGDNVDVEVSGTLDASGYGGGGEIDVTAGNVTIASSGVIKADAIDYGNGGTINLIASDVMRFYGQIFARGGAYSGNGGDVEVSGYNGLDYQGLADLTAANGSIGNLLLDPRFIIIHDGYILPGIWQQYILSAHILALQLAYANVTLQADEFIDVGATGNYNLDIFSDPALNALLNAFLNSLSTGNIDLSTWELFGFSGDTYGSLFLNSDTVNFNQDLIMGHGNLHVDANTINLDSAIYGLNGGGGVDLLDYTRMSSTAGLVNVLSNAAWIQQGLDLVADGGTVDVANGTYTENLVLRKSVVLQGNGATLMAANGGPLIDVQAGNSSISNFTLDGNGLADYGIYASGVGANGLFVGNNLFRNFGEAGIYLANTLGGTSTISNNIFNGSATRGVVFGTLGGGSTVNITNNTFGAAGDELVNALLFNQIHSANINISGGSMNTAGGGGPVAGDAIHFANGLHSGANVNISNVTVVASDEAIDFNGAVRSGSSVNINGGSYTGGLNGIEFANIAGSVMINNADIVGLGVDKRGINLLGNISGMFSLTGGSVVGGEDAIGSGNDSNFISGVFSVDGTELTGLSGHGIDIAGMNGGSFTVANATVHGGQNGLNFGGDLIDADIQILGNSIEGELSGISMVSGDIFGTTINIAGNSQIVGKTGDGIAIYDTVYGGGNLLNILNNSYIFGGDDGIDLNNLSGGTIQGNTIGGAGDNGIVIQNSSNFLIGGYGFGQGNEIYGARTGLRLVNTHNSNIVHNYIHDIYGGDTAGDGILIQGGQNLLLDGNWITNVGDEGIFASGNVDGLQIINNVISNTGLNTGASGNGIELFGTSGYAYIGGNWITNAGYYGIWIKDPNASSSFNVYGNVVNGADLGGIRIDGNALNVGYNIVTGFNTIGIHVLNSDGVAIYLNSVNGGDTGIQLDNSSWGNIAWNNVQGFSGTGVQVNGGSYVNVLHNIIHDGNGTGISVDGSHYIDIEDNLLFDLGGHGISVVDSYEADIIDNNLYDVDGNGIYLGGSAFADVAGNYLSGIGGNGIFVNNSHYADVYGNGIFDTGLHGIYALNSNQIDIVDNSVVFAGWDGVNVSGGYGALIWGNYIFGSAFDGIDVNNNAYVDIIDNEVIFSGDNGIEVTDSYDAYVAYNNIFGSDNHGIFLAGSAFADIVGNDVYNSGNDGIHVEDAYLVDINGNTVMGAGDDGIHVQNSYGANINYNYIDGVNGDGIFAYNIDNGTINGNTIYNTGDDGIDLRYSDYVDVLGNFIRFTLGDGIQALWSNFANIGWNNIRFAGDDGIDVENSNYVNIFANIVQQVFANGIEVTDSFNAEIFFNFISGVLGNGIFVDGSHFATISNNGIFNTGANGIYLSHSNYANILGNTVLYAGNDGIHTQWSSGLNIEGNYIQFSGDDGIDINHSKGVTLIGNTVADSGDDGINIYHAYNVMVEANTVTNSGDEGIQIGNVQGLTVANNTVTGSVNDGIQIDDSSGIVVDGNIVNNNGTEGIEINNSSDIVVSNNIVTDNGNGVSLNGVSNVMVEGNTISDNVNNGLMVNGATDLTIFNNILNGNDTGMYLEDVLGVTIEANTLTGNLTTGIEITQGDDVNILFNDITGSGTGLLVSGLGSGAITLVGNTFTDNAVGARFESGQIDISDLVDPNTFIGGGTALQFDGTEVSLVGDTLGATIFEGQSDFYVALSNGALFAPGTPTIIDGTNASFDGFVPSSVDFLTLEQLEAIESMLFDFDDLGSIGQIFVGNVFTLDNIEDFFRDFAAFNGGPNGFDLTVLGLPSVVQTGGGLNPAALNQIAPAAGEDATAEDVASIEPDAGAESTACLGDAVTRANTEGGAYRYSFGGSFEDSVAAVATCGTDNF